ncbi:hypothetical protein ACFL1V_04470 [Pseudomonadota bacterium]
MIRSFDVFDTLLVRSGYGRRDLLRNVAKSFALAQGEEYPVDWAERWFAKRLEAESMVREQHGVAAATLDQIYDWLIENFPLDIETADALKKTELEAEQADLQPIVSNRNTLCRLLEDGKEIAIMSDMYLPREELARMLRHAGMPVSVDRIFVSCEHNAMKWKGALFRVAASKLGVPCSSLLHLGDHFLADVASAWTVGARATWYHASRPTRHERFLAREGFRDHAGLAKQLRLCQEHGTMPPDRLRFNADICAPLLFSFLQWLKQEAQTRGLTRLYFVARDGWVLKKMAEAMDFGSIELRYLYGSRQAWRTADPQWKWAVQSGMSTRPDRILHRLGMAIADVENILDAHGITRMEQPLDQVGLEKMAAAWHSDEMRSRVASQVERRRGEVLGYMEQEGLLNGDTWALVDIGWSLSTQSALRTVLRSRNPQSEVRGFYIGLRRDRVSEAEAGLAWGYVCEEEPNPHARALIMQYSLLEQLATPAPHGTTLGYQYNKVGQWVPLLADNVAFVDEDACACVTELYRQFAMKASHRGLPAVDRNVILALCNRFFIRPNRSDVKSLSGLQIATDPGECDHVPVVGRFSSFDLLIFGWKNLIRKGQGGYFQRRFMWMAGSIPRWDLPMRLLFRLLVLFKWHGTRLS